jgi:opacity protein-like surface antigen
MRRLLACTALALILATPATAQQPDPTKAVQGSGTLPAGWMARVDGGAPLAQVKFETMPPGWHVTLGPAAIFYQPADTTSGNAHLVGKFHLFPGATHPESFGLFLGGTDLQGANQAYTYFLIRGDGKFVIIRRKGEQTTKVVDWTANPAVNAADSAGNSSNELTVLIKDGKVSFMVNGTEVHSASAADVDTKGVVGARINHNLSIHIEKLQVHRM